MTLHSPFRSQKPIPSPSVGPTSTCKAWPIRRLSSFWPQSLGESEPMSVLLSTFLRKLWRESLFAEVASVGWTGFGATVDWPTPKERLNFDNVWAPGSQPWIKYSRTKKWRERSSLKTSLRLCHPPVRKANFHPGSCCHVSLGIFYFLLSLLSWVFLHELEKVLAYSLHSPLLGTGEHTLWFPKTLHSPVCPLP